MDQPDPSNHKLKKWDLTRPDPTHTTVRPTDLYAYLLITFASVSDCLKNKRFIDECLIYTENNFSRTRNSLNCENFTTTLSVTFCIIQGDPHRPTQMDPTRPNPTQPDPTRPVDGPDPCPTLSPWHAPLKTEGQRSSERQLTLVMGMSKSRSRLLYLAASLTASRKSFCSRRAKLATSWALLRSV